MSSKVAAIIARGGWGPSASNWLWAKRRATKSTEAGGRTRWRCVRSGHRFIAKDRMPCPMCSSPVEGLGPAELKWRGE